MDFVDEEHVTLFQGSQEAGQIAGFIEDGPARHLHVHAHLVGDDVREGGFSQAGRAVEQRVVQCLTAHLGGFDIDFQVRDYFLLSGEIIQLLGADNSVQFIIFAVGCAARVEFAHGRSGLFQLPCQFVENYTETIEYHLIECFENC